MTLEANLIRPDAVRATPTGYEIDVHLPWYRSLPLSCVEDIAVVLAGRPAPAEGIRVHVDGRELALADLADLVDDWWFVQDPLTVVVADDPAPEAGAEVEVQVTAATRIPYIIIGPDTALVQRTRVARKVVVR
jgi:hypothetical protein